MTVRQTLLLLLFTVLLLSEMFGWQLGFAQGFSVKNAFLYALMMPVLFDLTVTRRSHVTLGVAFHMGFVGLIMLALLSWSFTDLNIQMPMYSSEERFVAIKSGLVDFYLFFLVFYFGVENIKQALFLAKAILLLVLLANVVTVMDVYNIPDLGVIQQMGEESAANEGRLKGPIGEPNQYAAFLLLFLPAYFALAFYGAGGWFARTVYATGAAVALVSLLLTGSRGGMLGLGIGLCWTTWLLRSRLDLWKIFRTLALLIPFAAAMVALVAMEYGALLVARLDATFNAGNAVTASAGRMWIWETGLGLMARHPQSFITGMGWQSFAPYVGVVSHNTYLAYLFSLGTLGLAAYLTTLNRVIVVAKAGTLATVGDARALMIAFMIGFLSLLVSVFFVDLYAPWYFVWAYVGILVRLATLAIFESRSAKETGGINAKVGRRFASLLR
jgi:hypothetical protein